MSTDRAWNTILVQDVLYYFTLPEPRQRSLNQSLSAAFPHSFGSP
jgi:hypothetical protein